MYDFVVIGSGIVGSFAAWELSKYQLKVALLEKESDLANGQTIANSGIIHSGHDPKEDTLKARLCVRGNELYRKYQEELSIPLRKTGAFVVAHDEDDLETLNSLKKRAHYNGVKEAFILSKEEALQEEPNLRDDLVGVLSLPTTMVTFPWEVCFNLLENASANGLEVFLNNEVINIKKVDNYYLIKTNETEFKTKGIINAAGVFSDEVAKMIETDLPFHIIPKRGEYFVLDHSVDGYLKRVLYPLPSKKSKGVLLTPQTHGNILVGPNAEVISDKTDVSTTQEGLKFVKNEAMKQAKNIPFDANIRTFAGVRASSNYEDFYLKESLSNPKVYHLGGVDSPGLTAAPAIAEYLIKMIAGKYPLIKKTNYQKFIKKSKPFKELTTKEKSELINRKPLHGNIICKCEMVTEQEIIASINSPVGSDTIKGIKKRTRAGAGVCQGGYCESLVLKIIAREKHKKMTEINYYEKGTPILKKETKE